MPGVQLADHRHVVDGQEAQLAVQQQPVGLVGELGADGLPEGFQFAALLVVEAGEELLPGGVVEGPLDQLPEARDPDLGRLFQQPADAVGLESRQALRDLRRQLGGDDPLLDRPLPGLAHRLRAHPAQRRLVSRHAGAEQGVVELRLDAARCRELARQGGHGDHAGVPAGLVGEVGDVLLLVVLLERGQPSLELRLFRVAEVGAELADQAAVLRRRRQLLRRNHDVQPALDRLGVVTDGRNGEHLTVVIGGLDLDVRLVLVEARHPVGDLIGTALSRRALGQRHLAADVLVHRHHPQRGQAAELVADDAAADQVAVEARGGGLVGDAGDFQALFPLEGSHGLPGSFAEGACFVGDDMAQAAERGLELLDVVALHSQREIACESHDGFPCVSFSHGLGTRATTGLPKMLTWPILI